MPQDTNNSLCLHAAYEVFKLIEAVPMMMMFFSSAFVAQTNAMTCLISGLVSFFIEKLISKAVFGKLFILQIFTIVLLNFLCRYHRA